MLDPEIKAENIKKMTQDEIGEYFDDVTAEIEEYLYGGTGADRKDFMFDAMSMIAWKHALDVIGVPVTPFIPIGKIQSSVIEHKKMRQIGQLCKDVIKKQTAAGQKVFIRTDVGVATETLAQYGEGFAYPGLKRGFTGYNRVNVDDSLKIAQYLSPNPEYIFLAQFAYDPRNMLYSYSVEDSVVNGPDECKEFVENIVKKFESLHIRPRHPQYIEHGTKDVAFEITVTNGYDGLEVFSASAFDLRVGKPMYRVNKL
ncbi:hypothetical protein EVB81_171 [Rhizobium phage RHph_I46]|uniref:Uncharacterized protein n=1 Tax=Rhizobium phage RHph_I1_9 TaxID=2509729 RepID=A0A7S5R9I5_9CAUD|nr:hypothetical protein PP936_gp170 [Rhizobium phage RHph_I1_9]QIG69740.1 hypothetical protein EVB81_171 [Rhizobium phage RHph_I46]QIG71021.1 hypothetical protein EVB92_171 [Rhizobium phage RHph_I9]QIG73607.1 hypothetical protein EVC04_170 [Rhizobium phage RHph_I1_9]QIG76360.1 hypothetical protein EVC25_171 [Rhizobium phage RHph_I34]